MKSVFQEASSLGSAIEKAWEAMGSPEGFEVKILKAGERNFFGFCKVPYAVCVTAANSPVNGLVSVKGKGDGRGSCAPDNSDDVRGVGRNTSRDWSSANRRDGKPARDKDSNGRSSFPRRNERGFGTGTPKDKFVERPADEVDESVSLRASQAAVDLEVDSWTADNARKAEEFLSSVLVILGLADFALKSTLENNFLRMSVSCSEGADLLEKSFFICIAPLIVQMVKKSTGEHLKGLRIVISQA